MAWTPPTLEEFAAHLGYGTFAETGLAETRTARHLQIVTDLITLASGCEEPPDADTPLGRVVAEGLMSLAHYFVVRDADREQMYSPFNSERIGSYSYSKAQMRQRAAAGLETGVDLWDVAVEHLRNWCSDGEHSTVGLITTEVMSERNPKETETAPTFPYEYGVDARHDPGYLL